MILLGAVEKVDFLGYTPKSPKGDLLIIRGFYTPLALLRRSGYAMAKGGRGSKRGLFRQPPGKGVS
jgi:hypothetical protein